MAEIKENKIDALDIDSKKEEDASLRLQFKLLRERYAKFIKREPKVVVGRIFQTAFFSLLMVAVFYGTDNPYTKTDLQDMLGFGFMLITGQFFFWTAGSLLTFQTEKPVFLREQANQMYDVKPYFLSKNILEVPFALLTPMISLLITYWSCGFVHNAADFFKLYLALFLVA